MKRISAKYESEWMNKPLNSNLHPIFQILQSKDPLSDLEKFLSENDIRLVFISLSFVTQSNSDWTANESIGSVNKSEFKSENPSKSSQNRKK